MYKEYDTVCECTMCGNDIYEGETYYRFNGEAICEDCLAEYAKQYFAPYRIDGNEERE